MTIWPPAESQRLVNPLDPEFARFKAALLAEARTEFPEFYAAALEQDAALMNGLIISYTAVLFLAQIPSKGLPPNGENAVERASEAFARMFVVYRQLVRACDTFAALEEGARAKIERIFFRTPYAV